MPRYISPPQSFLAYIDYDILERYIIIVFKKDGKQYKFSNLSKSKMYYFNAANNKGNYLVRNILKTKKAERLDDVPLENIKLIQDRYKQHLNLAK